MSNFRGPIRIEAEVLQRPDDPEAPEEVALRFFATRFPGREEVEVELRAGRGGVVFAIEVSEAEPVESPELPPNEDLRVVPPEARTTPISLGDFVHHE